MDNIEKLETKLAKLQNDIELLEKKINLADAEQRVTSVNNKSELKKNSLEMKQLRMQVEELQVRLKRQQLTDYKLMQEAIHEKCRELEDIKGNSAQEMFQIVESRVLDFNNKCRILSHRLQLLERTLNENENLLKEMTDACRDDDIPSEADCFQHMRHLENEQYKTLKNIEDCENAKDKMKAMLEYVRKKQKSHFRLFVDLKKGKLKMVKKGDEDVKEKHKNNENDDLEKKEKELEKLKKEISLIKDATGSYDIHDIDSAFLEQKSMKEDLSELIKKSEKRLRELKDEKKELASNRALMKEADFMYPKSEENLSLAKSRLKEQEIRLGSAKSELERLNSVSNRTKEVFQRLIMKMQPKVNKEEMSNKDIRHLTKQFENIVMYTFPSTEHTFALKAKKKSKL